MAVSTVTLYGCGKDSASEGESQAVALQGTTMNHDKRTALIEAIMAQYDAGAGDPVYPVVAIDAFFDGNEDSYSIAPNMVGYGHPGLEKFYGVLAEIRARENVQDVLVAILECPDRDDPEDADIWPSAECVYVLTSASASDVEHWAEPLKHSGVVEGWSGDQKPPAAPDVDPEKKVLAITWD